MQKQAFAWRYYQLTDWHRVMRRLYTKKFVNYLTRGKETYWLQRYSVGKLESDQIYRYLVQTERKFEKNWKAYEAQLEKYLTTKT